MAHDNLLDRYNCGPVKFSGGDNALYERHLTFDHDKSSRFPLEGAHEKVACSKCHPAPPGQPVKYKPLEQACRSCHSDVHAGQFSRNGPVACERCHRSDEFKPKTTFEHLPPFTDFLLDGQHAKAKCSACHRSVKFSSTVETVQYRPLPKTCEGCHSDFHDGAFQGFEP